MKLTRIRNVFQTGLQIMFGKSLYGRGRKVLKSMLQSPPCVAALTLVLFSPAPMTVMGSHEARPNTNTKVISNADVSILELVSNAIKKKPARNFEMLSARHNISCL